MDIALATEARAMYAHLLSDADKEKIASMRTPEELLSFLLRSPAWHKAAAGLPPQGATDVQFAEALSRCLFEDYERLYRFANDASKKFLIFMTYEAELKLILSALRRLSEGAVEESYYLPAAALKLMPGLDAKRLREARSFQDVLEGAAGSIYGPALRELELDPKTGKPAFNEAALRLEGQYYRSLDRLLHTGYDGPAKRELMRTVSFRADMLNISYLLRLRRFGTPVQEAMRLLLPMHGALGPEMERRILEADTDEDALAELRGSRLGKWLSGVEGASPEGLVRAAERAFYRKVMHGAPNLSVVVAFLQLKEGEARMLRRAFVALQYGLSPAGYMD